MNPTYLKSKFDAGLPYDQYLATGTADQIDNWQRIYDQVALTAPQQKLIQSFTRSINVVVLSGIWCGDCVQQGPLLARIAQAAPDKIQLRWLDRDAHTDLASAVSINGGLRVPVVLFLAEDHELVSWFGDRTLHRYRALAAKQLGAACPLPGASVDRDELAATLQDFVDEFERIHLLLRLSTRLRERHND